jgi:hypothetical protein
MEKKIRREKDYFLIDLYQYQTNIYKEETLF